ncbi:MAG: PAS domain-containing sensor histidine kinase [Sporocytophaga sp.]|uniref:PAS domain-containing sensor histidine kinase n=1 Tax=Sporocytophaga sp. TaxID=2231183 RepID=UPI001B0D1567|nr:PAS domain-containing sensor histidine kinase [Sporocytophaga sp.]MBO9702975.1 PAS domain-containing sensor histidine kinase [Sporocytophaga sp.]
MAKTHNANNIQINKSTFLNSMLANSRLACILILNKEGIIWEMSHGIEEQLGYTHENLIGKHFSILFTEEDLKENKPGKELQVAKEKGFGIDNNYIIHKNGDLIWCQGESIVVDDEGEIYFVKYIYNINKQKQLEESLKKSKKFSESVLETIDNPLIVLDSNLEILMANNSFHKVFNPHQEEIIKKSFFEIKYFKLNVKKLRELLEKILPESTLIKNYEIEFSLPDGQKFFHLNAQQVTEEGRKVQEILIAFQDVTDERIMKENLNNKNEELNKVNKDLDTFVYTASHDLKAPINNIEGLITVMENNPDFSEGTYEVIQLMRESIDKFKSNINDLSTIAKIEKEGNGKTAPVKLEELFEEVIYNLKEEIKKTEAIISSDFSQTPTLKFSRKNLRSIFHNLLSNAIKFKSPNRKPEISVITEKVNSYILLKVKDNGIGIKEEDKGRVLALYQRLNPDIEGSGVGMNIVKKIIDNNGGEIEIDSEVGKGSIFKIYIKI